MSGGTAQATFAATLVEEWVRCGLTDAVVAPGSRSTPLVLALAAHTGVRVHVFLDERSAAFFALGLGLATSRPAVVVTTSGTATAELHAAVVEASHGRVPLLVCTADRPPELHRVFAPQTVDQGDLFPGVLRFRFDPGIASADAAGTWRSIAARAWHEAVRHPSGPGPVHLNLPFRDPLVAEPGELPPGRADGRPWHHATAAAPTALDSADLQSLRALMSRRRGVIVAGDGAGDPAAVSTLAQGLEWPVLADPRSGCRNGEPSTVAAFDSILRHGAFAGAHLPDVVLHLGTPPASKVLAAWLATCGAEHVVVDRFGAWADPDRVASAVLRCDPEAFCWLAAEELRPANSPEWGGAWETAERAAQEAIEVVLARHNEVTEPAIARGITAALPPGATLFVSSSMPIRDVEWFGHPAGGQRVLANRGANGIDGVVSTALGVAASGEPVVGLIGDLAFLHDSGALLGAARRDVNALLVVVDNDGGGIFSFLPQAAALPEGRFEELFGTPHGVDLAELARVYGIPVRRIQSSMDIADAVRTESDAGGVRMLLAGTSRSANVVVHDEIHQAVGTALQRAGFGA